MPRAIWTGAISFGLVNVPIKLYSAVQRKTVRFNQLDSEGNVRIQQKRVNPVTGDEVPYDRLVKGYEIAPGSYVVVEPEELEALEPRRTKTIDILDFVDLEEIDPIFYDHPYYLAPGAGGAKPYKLLLEAMRETGKVAIAKVVIRSKESLVALRPAGDVLLDRRLRERQRLPDAGVAAALGHLAQDVELARRQVGDRGVGAARPAGDERLHDAVVDGRAARDGGPQGAQQLVEVADALLQQVG